MSNPIQNKTNPWLTVGRVVFTVCLALTIAFIFSNSLAVGAVSSGQSGRVLHFLQSLFQHLGLPQLSAAITEHFVRKLAHFCEFMLEGFWLMLCLRVYTRHFLKHISWPILFGLLTALSDESIQMFSDGRDARVADVWIDFGGVLTGLAAAALLLCLCRMFYILFKYRDKE